jgi:hypothetical protein
MNSDLDNFMNIIDEILNDLNSINSYQEINPPKKKLRQGLPPLHPNKPSFYCEKKSNAFQCQKLGQGIAFHIKNLSTKT